MTADQFYAQYGAGRTRTQFNRDCNAFFGGLATAQSSGSADTRERKINRHLANTRAMGPGTVGRMKS